VMKATPEKRPDRPVDKPAGKSSQLAPTLPSPKKPPGILPTARRPFMCRESGEIPPPSVFETAAVTGA
jgi:hypothetical protein